MYKVVIMDDEPIICRGLANKIAWNEWDCVVSGTAYNGIQGKRLIDELRPDLVITDIKMPGINGLELSEYVRNVYPDTIVILLTGHNDFEYARAAVRNGVFDFLLKPAEKDTIRETVQRAVDVLKQRKETFVRLESLTKMVKGAEPLAKSSIFLNLMLNGNSVLPELSRQIEELNVPDSKGQLLLFDLNPKDPKVQSKSDLEIFRYALKNIVAETFRNHKLEILLLDIYSRCCVFVRFESGYAISLLVNRVKDAAQEALDNIRFFFKLKAYVGIGDYFEKWDQVHGSFLKASDMLEQRLFWGRPGTAFTAGAEEPSVMKVALVSFKVDERLYTAIKHADLELAETYGRELIHALESIRSKAVILNAGLELLIHISKAVRVWLPDAELSVHFDTLKQCETFQEVKERIGHIIREACQIIDEQKQAHRSGPIGQAVAFLHKNYADSSVNLQMVADELNLSAGHLSREFKKEKEINFSDYLTLYRIERAKELLRQKPWLKNLDVAAEVGFLDGKYFAQVFKKQTDMTLAEYRQSIERKAAAKP